MNLNGKTIKLLKLNVFDLLLIIQIMNIYKVFNS